jgi:hypothetical protein
MDDGLILMAKGINVTRRIRFQFAPVLLLGLAFLVYSPVILAEESIARIIGTVVASGHASMKAGLDQWLSVDEKTYPVINGTRLRTVEGTASITTRDGAKIELGKGTELLISGALSNYSIQMQTGSIAFRIYEGIGLTVTTPSTSVVVQRVSGTIEKSRHTFKDEISGVVTHDGKDTHVICLKGKFSVINASAETLALTEGNRVALEDPKTVTQSGGAKAIGPDTPSSTVGVVRAYENPVRVPEILQQGTTGSLNVPVILQQAQTGGQEVVSENTP